jgi:glycosyltransferase involved in cell wall biosynthesis
LLDDPEQRAQLGAAARRFVETTYGWDALVPKLEALYDSTPERSSNSQPKT